MLLERSAFGAFSSEVGTGPRRENASDQKAPAEFTGIAAASDTSLTTRGNEDEAKKNAGHRRHHHGGTPRRRLMGQGEQPAAEMTRAARSRSAGPENFLREFFVGRFFGSPVEILRHG